MAAFGVDEAEARFMHAVESGEIEGDCVEVEDDDGAPAIDPAVAARLGLKRPEKGE